MNKFFAYLKREPVMCTAVVLAAVAICVVRPSAGRVSACIDVRVLSQLFCLMLTIQAFRSIRVLDALAARVLELCTSIRALYFTLVGLVFFASMAVTNDVALLTFVPFTLIICRKAGNGSGTGTVTPRMTAVLVVLETLAANLGSCITPMGNPQNLFLYSFYNMPAASFFAATLRIGVPSLVILCAAILYETKNTQKINVRTGIVYIESFAKCIVYTAVLSANLLAVFRVIDYRIAFAVTVTAVAVCNVRLFLHVDYSLLFTFVGFFIFTGTVSDIPAVSEFLKNVLKEPFSVYAAGILTSQVISNVPAALLLSGFTQNARELLLGVNIGGLGTLIASLASVISYKLFKSEGKSIQDAGYFRIFTVYNFVFLIFLACIVWAFEYCL
jgi:Na+/H+ antiporter NhaD/arsenite permease-like protein